MNQKSDNPSQSSSAMQNQAYEPVKSRGKGGRLILMVIVAALATTAIVAAKWNIGESDDALGGIFPAKRDDLVITVTEGGSIRAHKSIKYTCQVERRGGGDVTILSVVPAGTYITQGDVDNGMVLVELDASALKENLVTEKMELNGDEETMTSAEEAYHIQKIQNDSDVAESQLAVRFALMDLQKYMGARLAEQLTANIKDANDLSAQVAPLLEQVQVDPNLLDGTMAGQELKGLKDQIVLSQGNLKTAQATLVGTEKLHDANYVSDLDLDRDRLTVTNMNFREQDARVQMELWLAYDFSKNAEQYLSNYIEAGRKLERTYAQCRSLLAQAQAKRSNAREQFKEQESRVANYEQQIANCVIRAKAPGLVIYGSGDDSDRFRMMRGRGGGGGGMIAEGESVYEGQTLISMPDTADMVAEISVHETEVDKVRPGQPAEIVMDAFPDKRLEGEVLEVAPLPDQQRGFMNPDLKVYKTLVKINGTHEFLRTRMSCKVEILVDHLEDVIVVPIQVVANRGGRKVVYVRTATGSEEREVVTGSFNDALVHIIEGLEEGDEVLLNPPLITESASQSFQGRTSRLTEQAKDPNRAPSQPQGGQMRETPGPGGPGGGPGRGPGGAQMTPEQRKQFQERMQNMTPEQRQEMMKRRGGQGARRGGQGGQGPRREGGGGQRSGPPGGGGQRGQ